MYSKHFIQNQKSIDFPCLKLKSVIVSHHFVSPFRPHSQTTSFCVWFMLNPPPVKRAPSVRCGWKAACDAC